MTRWAFTLVLAAGIGFGAVANDEKKPETKPAVVAAPETMPEWSKNYATAGEIFGEIVKADEKGITLQVSELAPNGSGGAKSAKGKGKGKGGPAVKKVDVILSYADGGMVRWATKPKKTDEKGKPVALTPKEQEDLKKPAGAPGYAAARTDLQAGHIVQVVLLRPKSIAAKDAKVTDLEIKYVIIEGTDPNPPETPKDEEKGKEKKKKK
jgi:hypothetical protein